LLLVIFLKKLKNFATNQILVNSFLLYLMWMVTKIS